MALEERKHVKREQVEKDKKRKAKNDRDTENASDMMFAKSMNTSVTGSPTKGVQFSQTGTNPPGMRYGGSPSRKGGPES